MHLLSPQEYSFNKNQEKQKKNKMNGFDARAANIFCLWDALSRIKNQKFDMFGINNAEKILPD